MAGHAGERRPDHESGAAAGRGRVEYRNVGTPGDVSFPRALSDKAMWRRYARAAQSRRTFCAVFQSPLFSEHVAHVEEEASRSCMARSTSPRQAPLDPVLRFQRHGLAVVRILAVDPRLGTQVERAPLPLQRLPLN